MTQREQLIVKLSDEMDPDNARALVLAVVIEVLAAVQDPLIDERDRAVERALRGATDRHAAEYNTGILRGLDIALEQIRLVRVESLTHE